MAPPPKLMVSEKSPEVRTFPRGSIAMPRPSTIDVPVPAPNDLHHRFAPEAESFAIKQAFPLQVPTHSPAKATGPWFTPVTRILSLPSTATAFPLSLRLFPKSWHQTRVPELEYFAT